jgi:hypothetical protein
VPKCVNCKNSYCVTLSILFFLLYSAIFKIYVCNAGNVHTIRVQTTFNCCFAEVCGVPQKLREVLAIVILKLLDRFVITGRTEGYFVNKYSRLSYTVVVKLTELRADRTRNNVFMSGGGQWFLLFQNMQNFSGSHAAAYWKGTGGGGGGETDCSLPFSVEIMNEFNDFCPLHTFHSLHRANLPLVCFYAVAIVALCTLYGNQKTFKLRRWVFTLAHFIFLRKR